MTDLIFFAAGFVAGLLVHRYGPVLLAKIKAKYPSL